MIEHTEALKSMLQDIINGKHDQASVTMHEYFVAKTREVAGLSTSTGNSELDEEDSEMLDEGQNPLKGQKTAVRRVVKPYGDVFTSDISAYEHEGSFFVAASHMEMKDGADLKKLKKDFEEAVRTTAGLSANHDITVTTSVTQDRLSIEASFKTPNVSITFVDPYDDSTDAKVGPFESEAEAKKWFKTSKFHPDRFGEIGAASGRMMSPARAISKFSEKE